jgi:hypothetical protein
VCMCVWMYVYVCVPTHTHTHTHMHTHRRLVAPLSKEALAKLHELEQQAVSKAHILKSPLYCGFI